MCQAFGQTSFWVFLWGVRVRFACESMSQIKKRALHAAGRPHPTSEGLTGTKSLSPPQARGNSSASLPPSWDLGFLPTFRLDSGLPAPGVELTPPPPVLGVQLADGRLGTTQSPDARANALSCVYLRVHTHTHTLSGSCLSGEPWWTLPPVPLPRIRGGASLLDNTDTRAQRCALCPVSLQNSNVVHN